MKKIQLKKENGEVLPTLAKLVLGRRHPSHLVRINHRRKKEVSDAPTQ